MRHTISSTFSVCSRSPFLGLALLVGAPLAFAQGQTAPAPSAAAPTRSSEAEVAADSPRASLAQFLALTRKGKYAEAAAYLDLPPVQAAEGAEQARRLKAVLDRYLWVDLDSLSPSPQGDERDGLPPGVDQIGTIPLGDRAEPVRIVRKETPDGWRWLFSRSTVGRIDDWYESMGDLWVRRHLPDWWLRVGPAKLLRWQWLALPLLLALAYVLARLIAWPVRKLTARLVARSTVTWDDGVVKRLGIFWTLLWMWIVLQALLPWLELSPAAESLAERSLRAVALLTLFGVLYRAVDVFGEGLKSASWALGNPSARSALSIAMRSAQVAVVFLGATFAFIELGYPVASVLAGLGIGGLALALAAQKTVENLFGSVSLAADQAIRLGDSVRIDNFQGTVEGIGLRSTRLRTPERTLVTIPNGLLAGLRIESLTARDRMRLACTIGLAYGTTVAQIRTVLLSCERILRAQPKIWTPDLFVRFKEVSGSSLDIEILAWFETTWEEFTLIRQEVLLQFLEAVEEAGASLATSTPTINLVTAKPPAAAQE
jgi:MscS family membrane protein